MTQEKKTFEIKKLRDFTTWDGVLSPQASYIFDAANKYIYAANAEIRRLQGENEALTQQLAGAPSWGEWQDDKNQFQAGTYEVEFDNGNRVLLQANSVTLIVWIDSVTRFRRLNYEPKTALEVEKDYFGNTAKEWLESEGEDEVIGLLARDLLAAQAELRELKGKL